MVRYEEEVGLGREVSGGEVRVKVESGGMEED